MTKETATTGVEIRLDGVVKRYPGQKEPAVHELSMTIPAGEMVMFVGPSGCGKTTSLKMINRLIEPTTGKITIGGEDITTQNPSTLRRRIGYVIQGGGLLPHLSVRANIGLVPGLLGWSKQRIAKRTDELLELVGLDPSVYRDRYPRELSGGQQQRVGVARGLAADPPVILMDEPFGAVDPITRSRLQDELISIQAELHKTIVCVTHDIDEAIKLGDRIVVFREGARIAQYDTPEVVLGSPADDYVADFVGAGSRLKQLTLMRVGDANLTEWTSARIGEPCDEVLDRLRRSGEDSVIVCDNHNRPVGWVFARALARHDKVPALDGNALGTVETRATLNDAMDIMLESSHGGTVITERGRYRGVITFDAITDLLRDINESPDSGNAAAAEPDIATAPAANTDMHSSTSTDDAQ